MLFNDFLGDVLNEFTQPKAGAVISQENNHNFNQDKTDKFCKNAINYFFKHCSDDIIREINRTYGYSILDKIDFYRKNIEFDSSIFGEYTRCPIITKNMINQYFFAVDFLHDDEKMIQLEKTFDRMLFDVINEVLCAWKPMAFKGEVLPWKNPIRNLIKVNIGKNDLKAISMNSLQKISKWNSVCCGNLNIKIDRCDNNEKRRLEEIVYMRNEDMMTRILNWEVIEIEDRWNWLEDQKLETIVCLEEVIWMYLLNDLIECLE